MKKIAKLIYFPGEMVDEIKHYQEKNGIATFTGAVLELIRKALKSL